MNATGYIRVSTDDQAENGASLDAQHAAITQECERRGWTHTIHTDTFSGKTLDRPGLDQALASLEPGDVLIVAKLDRLTRSVVDLGRILEQAKREGWSLVALDLGVDMTTAAGELVANVMAAVAQWERRAISERTKAGLAAKRAQGVTLGRPSSINPELRQLARQMHGDGWTPQQIADLFNDADYPTPRGGQLWRDSSLRSALQ